MRTFLIVQAIVMGLAALYFISEFVDLSIWLHNEKKRQRGER